MWNQSPIRKTLTLLSLAAAVMLLPTDSHARWKSEDLECSPLMQPDFEADPTAYFDWLEKCITGDPTTEPPEPEPPCEVDRWIDEQGRCWVRIVCYGRVIVRPCTGTTTQPVADGTLGGIDLRADQVLVVVATPEGRRIRRIDRAQNRGASLANLVRVMVHRVRLPADEMAKIPPDFWAKQKQIGKARIVHP